MQGKVTSKKQSVRKAGHRSWAAGNAPVAGGHTGDIMSPETRSKVMSRIKGKGTGPERIIGEQLRLTGISFDQHVTSLPGKPDIVFWPEKLAVFIDGDFWHGWRFPLWRHKLAETWQKKIEATRERDQRNFRKLRQLGWKVIRIWEHRVERSPEECVKTILRIREMHAA
jgi:DNA mismatch endonuclease, patch repair protein